MSGFNPKSSFPLRGKDDLPFLSERLSAAARPSPQLGGALPCLSYVEAHVGSRRTEKIFAQPVVERASLARPTELAPGVPFLLRPSRKVVGQAKTNRQKNGGTARGLLGSTTCQPWPR